MAREITARFPGTVWKVAVRVGERVERDDDLLIIESMKMEIPMAAERDCVVEEIRCAEGDVVEEGQLLMVVEES